MTASTKQTRKPGRPPKSAAGAMTPAERARAYRERRKKLATGKALFAGIDDRVSNQVSTPAMIDALRDAFARHDHATGKRLLRELGQRLVMFDPLPESADE